MEANNPLAMVPFWVTMAREAVRKQKQQEKKEQDQCKKK